MPLDMKLKWQTSHHDWAETSDLTKYEMNVLLVKLATNIREQIY